MGKIMIEVPAPLSNGEEREIVKGIIAVNPNKDTFGSIQMRESGFSLEGGFMRKIDKVHFMAGTLTDLEAFVDAHSLTPGCDLNAKLVAKGTPPMAIQVVETTEPGYENHQPKINPTTAEVMHHDGTPIYRQTRLVSAANYQGDILLKMDKAPVAITTQTQIGQDPLLQR